jgi:hypothetical protein
VWIEASEAMFKRLDVSTIESLTTIKLKQP